MFTEIKNETPDRMGQMLECMDQGLENNLLKNAVRNYEVKEDVLTERLRTAERAVGKFFHLPEVPMVKSYSVAVELNKPETAGDDRLHYNLDQLRKMDCLSLADMIKVLSHEYGHRVLQDKGMSAWASELGGDYFTGVVAEMMGLPASHVEPLLQRLESTETHPGGDLRPEAVAFGHEVVSDMMEHGIRPTVENCLDAFCQSAYSRIEYPGTIETAEPDQADASVPENVTRSELKEMVDSPEFWEKEAKIHKHNAEWEKKAADQATFRGDHVAAQKHAANAQKEIKKAEECLQDAERHRRAQQK